MPLNANDFLNYWCGQLFWVVILDAGFASAANLKMLKDRGWSYLINITRGSRKQYAGSFAVRWTPKFGPGAKL